MSNSTTGASEPSHPVWYILTLGCLGCLSIILNTLLIFVIWRNKRTKEFHNGTTYIIGNLALADSLTGLAVLLYISGPKAVLPFQLSMVWTTILASLCSLILLSIERSIAFSKSFKVAVITIRTTVKWLVCIWLFSISCGIAVRFYKVPSQFALTVVYEVSVVIFTISHAAIYAKIKRNKRQMASVLARDRTNSNVERSNIHVNTVVLILIFVLVVTVLPYIIALQLILWDTLEVEPVIPQSIIPGVVKFVKYFYPIEILNFVVNPIIYSWRLKRYRKAFIEAMGPLLKCCGVKVRTPFVSSSTTMTDEDRLQCLRVGRSEIPLLNFPGKKDSNVSR